MTKKTMAIINRIRKKISIITEQLFGNNRRQCLEYKIQKNKMHRVMDVQKCSSMSGNAQTG